MQGVHSVADVRAAEAALMATLPDGALMERAAFALSVQCARMLEQSAGRVYGTTVVLLVGSGSNGGDALFAGARLARLGARVEALLLAPDRAHAAGLAQLRRDGGRVRPAVAGQDVTEADLVVDGIVGIGGSGELRAVAAELAASVSSLQTVAVDIPSGVDPDTGSVGGPAVRADVTVTFGALKPGLLCGAGAVQAGEIRLVDIGLGPHLGDPVGRVLEGADIGALLPAPDESADKYTRGVVGVVAGSSGYPGAGVLATGAALHGGAGMVRYLGLAAEAVRARFPEVVFNDGRVQAYVVGPGLGTDAGAHDRLAQVLATDVPVVVDADAITLLAGAPSLLAGRTAPTVLTPHDREFTRLGHTLTGDRLGSAKHAAAERNAVVLLKGNATVVADPSGAAYLNTTGTGWLATAGSGDVLAGLIGSLLASGVPALTAAAIGAHVHGVAGQLAALAGPPSAADVLAAVPRALRASIGGVEIS